jgi:hypothetical protein
VCDLAEGLITEIPREAIDSKSSVSGLLRKVKLAAAKLRLEKLASWVDLELNGYPTREVPEYRKFSGPVRWWNPYRGWQPLAGSAQIMDKLSDGTIGDSVANIEAMILGESRSLISLFPPALLEILSDGMGVKVAQAGVEFSSSKGVGILDAVRTAILDWAIEMEKAGVHGEGLSFSPAEQKMAQATGNVFNINSIGTFTGNLGAGNASGDITSSSVSAEKIKNLLSQVKSNVSNLVDEGVNEEKLEACIASIEAALKKSDDGLLTKSLETLQGIATEAAGGMISTGLLAMLPQILGTGASG